MGEIKDLVDTLKDLKGGFAEFGVFANRRSIADSATDGIAEFPVVVDSTIPLDDAVTIARALERKFASFMLITLTMNPYLQTDGTTVPSAAEYVKKYHQNMRDIKPRIGLDLDTALSLEGFDQIVDKYDLDYSAVAEGAVIMAHKIYENVDSRVANKQHCRYNFTIESVTNPMVLNKVGTKYPVSEAKGNSGKSSGGNSGGSGGGSNNGSGSGGGNSGGSSNSSSRGTSSSNSGNDRHGYSRRPININTTVNPQIIGQNKGSSKPTFADRRQLNHSVDAEFRKANDIVPTMLHLRVYPVDPKTNEQVKDAIDFVLGIKAILHPVDPMKLVDTLAAGIDGNNTFLDFIKWTTGETRFFKDFLFAIDKQKHDAVAMGDEAKKWMIASKRRGNVSRALSRFSKNALYPIVSLVITTDSLEILKENYGYDLDKMPALINSLFKTYFLLGFVKINTASQRVDIMIDNVDNVETVTLSTLSKEGSLDDRKFKDMMRMIGRTV